MPAKLIDLTGERFGRLVVLQRVMPNGSDGARWLCKCDCGNQSIAAGGKLRTGEVKSCGCYRREGSGRAMDLVGQRYGRLVVIEFSHCRNKKRFWKCRCDCGNEVVVSRMQLRNGDTKSCGCLHKERSSENGKKNKKHGWSKHSLFNVHQGMIRRCEDFACKSYGYYGGRGIKVCNEWHDIETFVEWAMNNDYKKGLEIDRIDNNGHYEPSNCRWVTHKENGNNKRNNHIIEVNGEKLTISQAADKYNVDRRTIHQRIRYGYKGEDLIYQGSLRWRMND